LCVVLAACLQAPSTAPPGVDTSDASAASPTSRWPQLPIHYWIDDNLASGPHASSSQKHCTDASGPLLDGSAGSGATTNAVTVQSIRDAIAAYQAQTPIRFTELTSLPASNPDFPVLIFTRGPTTDSSHSGGIPALGSNGETGSGDWQGCIFLTPAPTPMHTAEHEMGHQLGFIHEQRRSDYCGTVAIDEQCLSTAHVASGDHPFATIESSQNLAPYDIHSIMEYGNDSDCDPTLPGCDDGSGHCKHPTIMVNGCTTTTGACAVGGATDLSPDDINALYRMYEPSLGADNAGDLYGAAIAAGDFDGDGYTDLAVGSPGDSPFTDGKTGAVFLYKGTEGGLVAWKALAERDFVALGATLASGDRFGAAVASGHYMNHDNKLIDDLVVGAPGYGGGAGAVFVYRGWGADGQRQPQALEMDQTPAGTSTGGANHFGAAVAMGNVDGAHGGLVVGAPTAAPVAGRSGMVFSKLYGSSTWSAHALDQAGLWFHPPATAGYGTAVAISPVGGFAVGIPGDASTYGQVYVYDATGAFMGPAGPSTHADGDARGAALVYGRLGTSTAMMLAIGSPGTSDGGEVSVVQIGSAGPFSVVTTIAQRDVPGMADEAGDRFGASLAVGDVDGDELPDLAIGDPGENGGIGAVALVHGGSLTGWTRFFAQDGTTPRAAGDVYGTAVAVGHFGDVWDDSSDRNDDVADLAVGAPGRVAAGKAAGTVEEFLGMTGDDPSFQGAFDEARVNGIQARRTGAPPPLTCTAAN
jgi:hypothetical protein